VFLDFGGTLVEGASDTYAAYAWVLQRHGYEVSRERWNAADGRVLPRVEPHLYEVVGQRPSFWDRVHLEMLRELSIPDPGNRIVAALRERFTSPELHPPFPESTGVLSALRREGIPVHLVSNNTDFLLETLSRLGWDGHFASVTYSQEAGAEKPDPRVFALALTRAGVPPSEVVHVGDSWEADYVGARRAGLRGIWLNRKNSPAPAPCESLSDLAGLLKAIDQAP
jgi:putative hydrolase of the HAD superfamily